MILVFFQDRFQKTTSTQGENTVFSSLKIARKHTDVHSFLYRFRGNVSTIAYEFSHCVYLSTSFAFIQRLYDGFIIDS